MPGETLSAGFTGPTALREGQLDQYVRRVIRGLDRFDRFVSGAAEGLDTHAAMVAYEMWPDKEHVLVVPAAWHNRELVQWAHVREFQIIMAPGRESIRDAYMARNDLLVSMIDELFAFPATPEILRSGTWSTIRRARRRKLKIHYTELYR